MDATLPPQNEETRYADAMACRARVLVEAHSQFAGRSQLIEFEYDKGVLVVRGCLPTYYLKQMLQTALKNLEGVRLIDNRVAVDMSEGICGPIGSRGLC